MKYCSKCKKFITEDFKFCMYCGTWLVEKDENEVAAQEKAVANKRKKGILFILAMILFFFAAIMFISIFTNGVSNISGTLFYAVLGSMFLCLSRTPKESKFLFGKNKGLTKKMFVVISIILSFVILMIAPESSSYDTPYKDIDMEEKEDEGRDNEDETVPIEEIVISVEKIKQLVAITVKNEDYYTPKTYAEYINALEEANYIIINGADTQENVDIVAEYLESSIANLQKRADKTELNAKIEEAKSIDVSIYLPVTVSLLQETITNAEKVNEDINASETDVEQMLLSISNAISGLETPPDKTMLVTIIETAKEIDVSVYEPKTVADLNAAINNAEGIVTDTNARGEEVNDAISAIENAISKLELLPDKTKLEALLKKVNNYAETKYTTVSYTQLQDTAATAQIVYDNSNATQDEIEKAESILSEAIAALVVSTKCVWKITVDLDMIDNDNIGKEWDWSIIYKGEEVYGTFEITAKEGKEITIKGKAVEEDNSPDRGSGSITIKLKNGNSKSKKFTVKENRGRYAGRKAIWELKVSCELVERI